MRLRVERRLRKALRRAPLLRPYATHPHPASALAAIIPNRQAPIAQRKFAADILSANGHGPAVYRPFLDHFIACQDGTSSWETALGLTSCGFAINDEDERKLAEVLRHHPDEDRRAATAQLFGYLCVRRVPAVLLETLENRNETSYVRGRAAFALDSIGQPAPEVLAALIRNLQDPSPGARFWSVYALGGLVQFRYHLHPMAIAALEPLVDDPGDEGTNYWSVGREAQAKLENMIPARAGAGERERAAILVDPSAPAGLRRWAECYG